MKLQPLTFTDALVVALVIISALVLAGFAVVGMCAVFGR